MEVPLVEHLDLKQDNVNGGTFVQTRTRYQTHAAQQQVIRKVSRPVAFSSFRTVSVKFILFVLFIYLFIFSLSLPPLSPPPSPPFPPLPPHIRIN